MTTNVFLGRQPIFDSQRRTYAYELLYRHANQNVAFFSDPEDATRRVLGGGDARVGVRPGHR